ncbi:hypothetical protein [Neisseria perflava]|uniref:hypothetical protein n=1 Tax=Neisseria perflava TaxID=33053 RepID=UPI0020A06D56|nr:hypothetical protein [Neisseria perflava]MCP1659565.1 drug/metabolite transporter (DMT)-like permease [Neisseria perflava]MCP1772455.1 drug/metabolite transporter (DMT)-like permease [Neisseria perflava]
MENEKIHYFVIILLCAASMLLSPFFYVRRSGRVQQRPIRWKPIVIANLVMIAALLLAWWLWF